MRKYIIFFISLFLMIIPVYAKDFSITGKYAIIYNLNEDSILFEQSSEEKTPIASLTKIMTSIVAIENIDNLDDEVIIKYSDFYGLTGYSTAGFKVGDIVTYRDLLYGALLPSGAEAVSALVNNTLGSNFIDEMNNTAKRIGLTKTSFSNTIGKDDENNYSTAKDIATLLKYALNNEEFKNIFTTRYYKTTNGQELTSTLVYYGKNLDYDIIDGSKTGFTSQAGRCLASISSINGVNYLSVVINSNTDNISNAIADSLTMYNYYGNNYSYQVIINKDNIIETIPIRWSKEKEYNIYIDNQIEMYLKNNTNENLNYVYEGINEIKKDTKKDTKLGILRIYDNDTLLYETDVYLLKDIKYYHPLLWIIIAIIILFLIKKIFFRKKRKKYKK